MEGTTQDLFDKLVAICARSENCVTMLRECATRPDAGSFQESLKDIEDCLQRSKDEAPAADASSLLKDKTDLALFTLIVQSEPLLDLFQSPPFFATTAAADVNTLAQFADIQPDPDTVLNTRDAVFMRVLQILVKVGVISASRLLEEDLEKLVTTQNCYPELIPLFYQLAQDNNWLPTLQTVENALNDATGEQATRLAITDTAAAQLLAAIKALTPVQDAPDPQSLIMESPRFCEILPGEMLTFWKIRQSLPSAEALLAKEVESKVSLIEKSRRVAREIITANVLPAEDQKTILSQLEIRIQIARHLLDLRTFAKLDAFTYQWPKLADLLQTDRLGLIAFERQLIQSTRLAEAWPDLWKTYQTDDALKRFLKLRPFFGDIYPSELAKYLQASQAVAAQPSIQQPSTQQKITLSSTQATVGTPSASPPITDTSAPALQPFTIGTTALGTQTPPQAGETGQSLTEEFLPAYKNLFLALDGYSDQPFAGQDEMSYIDNGLRQIKKIISSDPSKYAELDEVIKLFENNIAQARREDNVNLQAERKELYARIDNLTLTELKLPFRNLCELMTYSVTLRDWEDHELVRHDIDLPWMELRQQSAALSMAYRGVVYAAAADLATQSRRIARASLDARELGEQIYDWIFQTDVRKPFMRLLRTGENYRILIELHRPELASIAWESLYLPEIRTFLGLTTRYSLIRYIPNVRPASPKSFTPPLRLLAVFSNPPDLPPLNVEQEEEILRRTLANAVDSGIVKLEVLKTATVEAFQSALRVFRPHIFHFVGHGIFDQQENKGGLVFAQGDSHKMVWAQDFEALLADSRVSIAVLNGCDTGMTATNDAYAGVATAILGAGVPAVVATMRPVVDSAALVFTREFYRSLVDGYTLEAALVEARKALSVEKWDWPSYALYAGTTSLDSLKLLPQPFRTS